jgi:hypothetical protein
VAVIIALAMAAVAAVAVAARASAVPAAPQRVACVFTQGNGSITVPDPGNWDCGDTPVADTQGPSPTAPHHAVLMWYGDRHAGKPHAAVLLSDGNGQGQNYNGDGNSQGIEGYLGPHVTGSV